MGAAMVRATNDAGAPLRIAVVGCGVEGRVAVEYWRERGEVVVHDSSAEVALPPGVATRTGPDYLRGLDEVDLIVRSPGVRPDDRDRDRVDPARGGPHRAPWREHRPAAAGVPRRGARR
jgi:UDP-N-acetylmuramoylalanine-D-glutamate ligase